MTAILEDITIESKDDDDLSTVTLNENNLIYDQLKSELTLKEIEEKENLKKLPIIYFPDKQLKSVAKVVKTFDEELISDIRNIFYSMRINDASSVAAPQFGINKRILIINVTKPLILINPILLTHSEETEISNEGCLCFPDYFTTVKRYKEITIAYQNEVGQKFSLKADNILSLCIQHELSYLDGKTFIDHFSSIKKMFIGKKITKIIKNRKK